MSKTKGAFGKVRGRDGKVYDDTNNTIDGALPIAEGDCFYYRAKANPSAQVHLVKCRRITGRIALLSLYNAAREPEASMFVELSRIECIQQAAPIPDADDHEERILLRRSHLGRDFADIPLAEIRIHHFTLYLEGINLASHVVFVDGNDFVHLKSNGEVLNPPFEVHAQDLDGIPEVEDCAEPILKPEPFPPPSPAGEQ